VSVTGARCVGSKPGDAGLYLVSMQLLWRWFSQQMCAQHLSFLTVL